MQCVTGMPPLNYSISMLAACLLQLGKGIADVMFPVHEALLGEVWPFARWVGVVISKLARRDSKICYRGIG